MENNHTIQTIKIINETIREYKIYFNTLYGRIVPRVTNGAIDDLTNEFLYISFDILNPGMYFLPAVQEYCNYHKIMAINRPYNVSKLVNRSHKESSSVTIKCYSKEELEKVFNKLQYFKETFVSILSGSKFDEFKNYGENVNEIEIIDHSDKYTIPKMERLTKNDRELRYFKKKALQAEERGYYFDEVFFSILDHLVTKLNIKNTYKIYTYNNYKDKLNNIIKSNYAKDNVDGIFIDISDTLKLSITSMGSIILEYECSYFNYFYKFRLYDDVTKKLYVWDFIPYKELSEPEDNITPFYRYR